MIYVSILSSFTFFEMNLLSSMTMLNKIGEIETPCLKPLWLLKGLVGVPSTITENETNWIQLLMICMNRGEKPNPSRVTWMTSYKTITVSKAFLRSILKQDLLGIQALPKPCNISSARRMLSGYGLWPFFRGKNHSHAPSL